MVFRSTTDRVTVTIKGQTITYETEHPLYVEDIRKLVEEKLEQVEKATGEVNTLKLQLYALVELAEELYRVRMKKDADAMQRQADELVKILDEAVLSS